MKCPRCGSELKPSKKDPSYGLCYDCKKKFKLKDKVNEDDFELDDFPVKTEYQKKPKKKKGCLTVIVLAFLIIVGLGAIATLFPSDEEVSNLSANISSKDEQTESESTDSSVPTEYKSALKKAEQYSEIMNMSKQGIYDQLVSEYGEQFSAEAAQYAIDNLKVDYKQNALEKAKTYQSEMSMSPEAIRDQLTSEYGEKFTQEEADYAIANLP